MATKTWLVCHLLACYLLLAVCMAHGNVGQNDKAAAPFNFTLSKQALNFTEAKAANLAAIYHSRRRASATKAASSPAGGVYTPLAVSAPPNATEDAIRQARSLVAAAHASQAAYNADMLAHPRFNTYRSRHGTSGTSAKKRAKRNETPHPVLTDDVLAAIKLVGHADAVAMARNNTLFQPIDPRLASYATRSSQRGDSHFKPNATAVKRDNPAYWVGQMDHLGTQPFGGDSSYKVRQLNDRAKNRARGMSGK